MASRINEELMKTNLDLPDGEIKLDGVVNPVYADAINVHNKKKKETEKVLKDKKPELKKAFLGTKGETTVMPRTSEMKKLKLSEDMFRNIREHYSVKEAVATPIRTRKDWELQDKRNNKDIWSDIYNELVDMKDLETPHRQLKKSPKQRYSGGWDEEGVRVAPSRTDDAIVVYADDESQLAHAKEVAEAYGVEFNIREHTSRYAEARFEMKIYPTRPATNESLDTAKAFGRKAKSKDLKESANGEIYSKVAKYFEYGAPAETVDTICDIVDRAVSNVEDGYELDEAIGDALDNGLIYTKDLWAIKHYYEDSELEDGTYESLYNDIYSITSSLVEDNDVDESLKEDKNGKFVGQFSRVQTDDEMNGFVNLIKNVAQENGFDTSKMTVDTSTNVTNNTLFGVGTDIKVTIPIHVKDKPFRASNKDTISGLTNIVFTCTAEKGYSDYENHIDQLGINKGHDKDDFDAEQFTIRATTNGTVKPYRKRYTYRLEGKGHYMYNGIIEDFRQDLDTYFRELKAYLGI